MAGSGQGRAAGYTEMILSRMEFIVLYAVIMALIGIVLYFYFDLMNTVENDPHLLDPNFYRQSK
jgi:ABC-type multidrug transport system permease subunit